MHVEIYLARLEKGDKLPSVVRLTDLRSSLVVRLSDAIKKHSPVIETLALTGTVDDDGAQALASVLAKLPKLTKLELARTGIGVRGGEALGRGLASCTALEYLDLRGNSLSLDGVAAVAKGVSALPNLRHFDASEMDFGDDGVIKIVHNGLGSMSALQCLNLTEVALGLDGVVSLAVGLGSVPQLRHLFLGSNRIHNDGLLVLINKALPVLTQLQSLDLSSNSIGPDPAGIVALAALLPSLTKLQRLVLARNPLGKQGALALAEQALPRLPALADLDVAYIAMGDEGTGKFLDALGSCAQMQRLSLSTNRLGDAGFRKLARAVAAGQLSKLTMLNVAYNDAGEAASLELFSALTKHLPEMCHIDLVGNDLGAWTDGLDEMRSKTEIARFARLIRSLGPAPRGLIMFVGNAFGGKTSLQKAIRFRERSALQQMAMGAPNKVSVSNRTVGVVFRAWRPKLKHADLPPEQQASFSLWDFAGQEVYYTTHQIFLGSDALYILVVDCSMQSAVLTGHIDEEQVAATMKARDMDRIVQLSNLPFWLQSLQSRHPGARVVVVGTHRDVVETRYAWPHAEALAALSAAVHREFDDAKAQPPLHVALVASHGRALAGINELRDQVFSLAMQHLSSMREVVPHAFARLGVLAEKIAFECDKAGKPPVLTHAQMLARAKQEKLQLERVEFDAALAYLENTGSVLLHRDNSVALQTAQASSKHVIVQPGWILQLLNPVINHNMPSDVEHGWLRLATLRDLWTKAGIATSFHDLFLELMTQLQLARVEPITGWAFIPALLPNQESAAIQRLSPPRDGDSVMHREVVFHHGVPPGVLHRLAVVLAADGDMEIQAARGRSVRIAAHSYRHRATLRQRDSMIEVICIGDAAVSVLMARIFRALQLVMEMYPGADTAVDVILPCCDQKMLLEEVLLLRRPLRGQGTGTHSVRRQRSGSNASNRSAVSSYSLRSGGSPRAVPSPGLSPRSPGRGNGAGNAGGSSGDGVSPRVATTPARRRLRSGSASSHRSAAKRGAVTISSRSRIEHECRSMRPATLAHVLTGQELRYPAPDLVAMLVVQRTDVPVGMLDTPGLEHGVLHRAMKRVPVAMRHTLLNCMDVLRGDKVPSEMRRRLIERMDKRIERRMAAQLELIPPPPQLLPDAEPVVVPEFVGTYKAPKMDREDIAAGTGTAMTDYLIYADGGASVTRALVAEMQQPRRYAWGVHGVLGNRCVAVVSDAKAANIAAVAGSVKPTRGLISFGTGYGAYADAQRLGDVMVSEVVHLWQDVDAHGRQSSRSLETLTLGVRITHSAALQNWSVKHPHGGNCDWFLGGVLAGTAEPGSTRVKRRLLQQRAPDPDGREEQAWWRAIGGDASGTASAIAAVSTSTSLPWVMVRGVGGYGDGGAAMHRWQSFAAHSAALLLKEAFSVELAPTIQTSE